MDYWKLIYFAVNLMDTIILFKYIGAIIGAKAPFGRKWIWIGVLSSISFIVLDMSDLMIFKIGVYLTILLFIHFLFEGKILKKILGFLILLVILAAIENLVVVLLMTLLQLPVALFAEDNPYRLLAIVLSKLVSFVFVTWFARRKENNLIEVKMKASFVALVTGFFLIIMAIMSLVFQIYEVAKINDLYVNLLVLSSAIVCILAIGIYESMFRQAREQMNLNLLNQQKELQFKYANAVESSIDEMKKVKHDFANHMMCIQGYLELDRYQDLGEYVKKLSNPIEKSNEILVLGHPVISSLIYSKVLLAKKEQITMNMKTTFDRPICIEDIDLCVLIGNVLDNALEACMQLEEGQREMTVSIETKSEYFLFDCKNTMNKVQLNKENGRFKTSKADKDMHGIGLMNIRSVVDKYAGDMVLDTEEDIFSIKVTLQNKLNK